MVKIIGKIFLFFKGDENIPRLTPVTNDSIDKAVEAAIDVGFRHIDTASIYFIEDQVTLRSGRRLTFVFVFFCIYLVNAATYPR